jgi:hypothetical protein
MIASNPRECERNWLTAGVTQTLGSVLTALVGRYGIAEVLDRLADLTGERLKGDDTLELVKRLESAVEAALNLNTPSADNIHPKLDIELPADVPLPKFSFGSRIKDTWEDIDDGLQIRWGSVVGISWNADKKAWEYHFYWDEFSEKGIQPYYDDVAMSEEEFYLIQ